MIDLNFLASAQVTVPGEPKVTLPRAVVLMLHGEEIGSVDAVYDFAPMPEEYHELALQAVLARGAVTLHVGSQLRNMTPTEPTPRRWWQFWRKG